MEKGFYFCTKLLLCFDKFGSDVKHKFKQSLFFFYQSMRYLRKNKEKSLALTFTLKTNKDAFEVATEEVNCLT